MAAPKKKKTTTKRKTSSTAKKKPSSAPKRKPGKLKRAQRREEIIGFIIGVIGIYIFLCIFTEYAGKWGEAVHGAMFGSFGVLAYALPFAVVALGIAVILKRKRKVKILNIVIWSVFAICVVCIFHIASLQVTYGDSYDKTTFKSFVYTSYTFGRLQKLGAGALAAMISYPLVKNIDAWGAYLVFAAYIIIVILIKLRVSLRKVGRDVGDKITETSSRINENVRTKAKDIIERRRLYIDDLSEDSENYREDIKVLTNNDFPHEPEKEREVPEFLRQDQKRRRIDNVPIKNLNDDIPPATAEKKKKDTTEEEWNKAKADVGKDVETPPYVFPPLSLLERSSNQRDFNAEAECRDNAVRLEETLESFGIPAKVMQVSRGPAVTRFELQPPPGVKISRITNLSNDIALSLAAQGVRIEAPIPGKAAIGIEIPNEHVSLVKLRDIIESSVFTKAKSALSFSLGKDIAGKNVVADLSRMPHMLIAGATGSGKSVCINSIIISLIYKSSPDDVRMILIDPKRVELSIYNGIPHLLIPVVNDAKKAAGALNWAINEMSKRYQLFSDNMARDIHRYNELAEGNDKLEKLPQIVIIIDELADLMAIARNEVEDAIVRLAQLARAAGIHLVIATQRPSVDVITGLIKANIPTRIAFSVYSQIDARTIMDTIGAEKLLGRGDMLFNPSGAPKPIRLQGAFVSEKEVHDVTKFIKNDKANYNDEVIEDVKKMEKSSGKGGKRGATEMDEPGLDNLIHDGIDVIFDMEQASISLLQRKLRVGYARAARIVDDIERVGAIGPKNGSKPREILATRQQAHEKADEFEG